MGRLWCQCQESVHQRLHVRREHLFDVRRGTRDPHATALFDAVLSAATPALLSELAERHGLEVDFDPAEPLRYATTGGL